MGNVHSDNSGNNGYEDKLNEVVALAQAKYDLLQRSIFTKVFC